MPSLREWHGTPLAETGQEFAPAAVARTVELTAGQPWLVNALAREIVQEMAVPAPEPITPDHVDRAKERLILARATHLPRRQAHRTAGAPRRRAGAGRHHDPARSLRRRPALHPRPRADRVRRPVRIANPIYREVVIRVLGAEVQANVVADPRSFVLADGRLDFPGLLREFTAFWIQNGDVLTSGLVYHEAAPHLVFMAFLQRVVNGGGQVEREVGVGRGRIDLLVRWPHRAPDGRRTLQREAVELKVWRAREADPLTEGLAQLDGYLDRLGLDTGVLIVFDRRPQAAPIAERTAFDRATSPSGRPITVLRA